MIYRLFVIYNLFYVYKYVAHYTCKGNWWNELVYRKDTFTSLVTFIFKIYKYFLWDSALKKKRKCINCRKYNSDYLIVILIHMYILIVLSKNDVKYIAQYVLHHLLNDVQMYILHRLINDVKFVMVSTKPFFTSSSEKTK